MLAAHFMHHQLGSRQVADEAGRFAREKQTINIQFCKIESSYFPELLCVADNDRENRGVTINDQ